MIYWNKEAKVCQWLSLALAESLTSYFTGRYFRVAWRTGHVIKAYHLPLGNLLRHHNDRLTMRMKMFDHRLTVSLIHMTAYLNCHIGIRCSARHISKIDAKNPAVSTVIMNLLTFPLHQVGTHHACYCVHSSGITVVEGSKASRLTRVRGCVSGFRPPATQISH